MEEELSKQDDIDDGIYAIPRDTKAPRIKVRALMEYCDKKGVKPKELSEEELESFLVYPK